VAGHRENGQIGRNGVSDISVIVPATDGAPHLERCLAAIESSRMAPDEVIVVRDAECTTPAAARNLGVARSAGQVIVFIDADVAVHPDAIGLLVSALEGDPGLAAAFGSYDERPEAPGATTGFRYLLHHSVHQASGGEAGTFWSGIGAIRRDAFDESGGFDPERRWLEDVEFGVRLTRGGERIVLEPGAQGTHLKGLGAGEMVRSDALERAVPWVEVMAEHRTLTSDLNLGWRHRLLALLAFVGCGALALGRPRVALLALAAFALIDAPLIGLVARSRGGRQAAAVVPLHVAHHLAGGAGAVAGLVAVLVRRASARA